MEPNISYLICATPRCGGYLLFEALESTGLAGKPGEYFWEDSAWAERWGATDYTDFLNEVKMRSTTPNGVFGTKLMWGYFQRFVNKVLQTPPFKGRELVPHAVLTELFPNLVYIWIMRRDKVRQAVSLWKGLQTGIWWKRVGDPTPTLEEEPTYDFEAIDYLVQEFVFHEAAWQTYFTQYGITPFTVIYEDFAPAYEETAFKVMDWLGVAYPEDLSFGVRSLQKQADDVSEAWVQKYHTDKQHREHAKQKYSPFSITSWNFKTADIP